MTERDETIARARKVLLALLVALFGLVGAVHLAAPEIMLPIMPGIVPHPLSVIVATGLCEWLGCLGLVIPRFRRAAGAMLALYCVCVFPANVKQALEHIPIPMIPDSWWYHGPRLAFQPVLIWTLFFASGWTAWPFTRRARRAASAGLGPHA